VIIRQFGGPRPDGGFSVAGDQVYLVEGARYVVLLRNTFWNLSPVVKNYALRVEDVDGVEALIDTAGRAVAAVESAGPSFTPPLFAPVPQVGVSGAPPRLSSVKAPSDLMSREEFVDSLKNHARARGMAMSGTFYDLPEAHDDWRTGENVASNGPRTAPAAASGAPIPDVIPPEFKEMFPATEGSP